MTWYGSDPGALEHIDIVYVGLVVITVSLSFFSLVGEQVVPSTPLITLQDLLDSKIGGTVCGILTNVREFWLYDNREALQHEEETDDD